MRTKSEMDAGESTHPDKAAKFEYQIKLGGLFFDHFVGKCVKALSGQARLVKDRYLRYPTNPASMNLSRGIFTFLLFAGCALTAQPIDSTKTPSFFRGQITATNNGISLVPNFSLGRPAALFDLSVGKGRFSFDPWLRFGLDTKPWVFIFWFRY